MILKIFFMTILLYILWLLIPYQKEFFFDVYKGKKVPLVIVVKYLQLLQIDNLIYKQNFSPNRDIKISNLNTAPTNFIITFSLKIFLR